MNVQPIIDLWIMEPYAYILVDSQGDPCLPNTPRELFMQIDEAMERSMIPLVVCRPQFMVDGWCEFIAAIPEENSIWLYEKGEIIDHEEKSRMSETANLAQRWQRGIGTIDQLKEAMKAGIRFGSGAALVDVDPLDIKDMEKYRVHWT